MEKSESNVKDDSGFDSRSVEVFSSWPLNSFSWPSWFNFIWKQYLLFLYNYGCWLKLVNYIFYEWDCHCQLNISLKLCENSRALDYPTRDYPSSALSGLVQNNNYSFVKASGGIFSGSLAPDTNTEKRKVLISPEPLNFFN